MQKLDTKSNKKLKLLTIAISIMTILILVIIAPKTTIELTTKKQIFTDNYAIQLNKTINKPVVSLNLVPAISAENPSGLFKKHLTDFIIAKINKEITPNQTINTKKLKYKIKTKEADTENTILFVETEIIPKISTQEIKNNICGKSINTVKNYLRKLPFVESFNIKSTPLKLFFTPFLKSRIKIVIN